MHRPRNDLILSVMSSLNDPIHFLSLFLQKKIIKKSDTKTWCACFCATNKIAIVFGNFSCGAKRKSVDSRVGNLLDWQSHLVCTNKIQIQSAFLSFIHSSSAMIAVVRIHFMSKSSIAIGYNHHKYRAYFDVMVKINLLLDVQTEHTHT